MDEQPRLIVIGGANGSGKTTLAREYIAAYGFPYLGADLIAYELNPSDVESVAIEAGRKFISKIAESIEKGDSFIVESTLSGLSLQKWIRRAAERSFRITTAFVYLDTPELCMERVASRVARGGHHVPAEDIIRRYERSNINFWKSYKVLSSDWQLSNNTGEGIYSVAHGDTNDTIVSDIERFERWLRMVN